MNPRLDALAVILHALAQLKEIGADISQYEDIKLHCWSETISVYVPSASLR